VKVEAAEVWAGVEVVLVVVAGLDVAEGVALVEVVEGMTGALTIGKEEEELTTSDSKVFDPSEVVPVEVAMAVGARVDPTIPPDVVGIADPAPALVVVVVTALHPLFPLLKPLFPLITLRLKCFFNISTWPWGC